MNIRQRWARLNTALTPDGPRDWRTFILDSVLMLVVWVSFTLLIGFITGNGVELDQLAQNCLVLYLFLGAAWWTTLFQYLDDHRHDLETEVADRRLQRRGAIFWIAIAYAVSVVQLIAITNDGSDTEGEDDTSVVAGIIGLVIVLLLPLFLAWITAMMGRSAANWLPQRRS